MLVHLRARARSQGLCGVCLCVDVGLMLSGRQSTQSVSKARMSRVSCHEQVSAAAPPALIHPTAPRPTQMTPRPPRAPIHCHKRDGAPSQQAGGHIHNSAAAAASPPRAQLGRFALVRMPAAWPVPPAGGRPHMVARSPRVRLAAAGAWWVVRKARRCRGRRGSIRIKRRKCRATSELEALLLARHVRAPNHRLPLPPPCAPQSQAQAAPSSRRHVKAQAAKG